MKFTSSKKRIALRGVNDEVSKCSQISKHKLKGLIRKKAVTHMLELQAVCPIDRKEQDSYHQTEDVCTIAQTEFVPASSSHSTDL